MVFDIIGIGPPLANALRRVLISEISTMAIESVIINQNTSIIPDEVLAHRLGLIPIYADANEFQYKKDNDEFNENNSISFKLCAKCGKNTKGEVVNSEILSNQLIFIPKGKQAEYFIGKNTIRPVYDDILINKLRPGQEIDAELICVKGIGKTHAKWSPVCTAYYRLLPNIEFKNEIEGKEAEDLKALCPMKVFDTQGKDIKKAIVNNIRNCTTCRECIHNPLFKDKIKLGKASDHYECNNLYNLYVFNIVHIESVGIYKPEEIFFRALTVLKEKSEMWTEILHEKISGQK